MKRTGFDVITSACRKYSKVIRCWDFDEDWNGTSNENYNYMTVEVELDNYHTNKPNEELVNFAKEIISKTPSVKITHKGYDGGSDYDSYTFWLKEKVS